MPEGPDTAVVRPLSISRSHDTNELHRSWRDVYTSVHSSPSSLPPGIRSFLSDAESYNLLKRPLAPFLPPSSGTKSQFDHRTAAINITPDDSAPYNLTQIKEDALWLSTEGGIDEVVALRVSAWV